MLRLIPFILAFGISCSGENQSTLSNDSVPFSQKIKTANSLYDNTPIEYIEGASIKGNLFSEDKTVEIAYRYFQVEGAKGNVVVSHGFSENMDKFREIVLDFTNAGYNTVAIEHRGHGRSTRIDDSFDGVHVDKFDNYVLDLKTVIDGVLDHNLKTILFAHSMGGAITGRFIEQYPNAVSAVVLSAPMMEFDTQGFPKWVASALASGASVFDSSAYALGQNPPKPLENDTFEGNTGTHSEERWSAYQKRLAPIASEVRVGGASWGWVKEAIAFTGKLTSTKELAKVKVPVLMFQAGDDSWVLPGGQDIFCAAVKTCQKEVFAESRHEIFNEVESIRAPYMAKVLNFLDANK